MNNFGVYADENTFDFSHEHPIILIGGMNGRGKTTFLEAILLSLYGPNSPAYKESDYKSYGRYLRSYVNKGCWNQTAYVDLEFVMNESTQNTYLVHREWDALGKRTSESISVYENGEYSEFLTKNWAMFVENILPSALSRFFFFDGEKIAELAVDDVDEQMKDSIRSMLGIGVLDVLKKDLSRVIKRTERESFEDNSQSAIKDIEKEKENLEGKIEALENNLQRLEEELDKERVNIEELHQQYEIKGGAIVEQQQALMQRRADLLAEVEQNKASLIECAAGVTPLIMVRELLNEILPQAEYEYTNQIMHQAVGVIENLLDTYSKEHTDEADINVSFINYVKKAIKADSSESVYQLSGHALFQLKELLDGVLEQNRKKTRRLLRRKKNLKKDLDKVESYLAIDLNEKVLDELSSTIRTREVELSKKEAHFQALEKERSSANHSLTMITAKYNKAVESYLQNAELLDDNARMKRYSTIALKITKEYAVALQKKKTGVLAATITDCYKMLANKKNFIQKIAMNPETLDLVYLDSQDEPVSKESLSAGEKQLMVIAILWALAKCSKKKLPVIIDTPLSRLDSMHRTSLATTYFPNASDQTIILSTDSEIDQNYYNLMKHAIGDEYTLSYDEETKSTTILKGYFQNDN